VIDHRRLELFTGVLAATIEMMQQSGRNRHQQDIGGDLRLDQAIEGEELHVVIVFARVQAIEIRSAVDAEQHGFAVDHEGRIAVAQRGFRDLRISIRSVVAGIISDGRLT
jgi:hypothetical protein